MERGGFSRTRKVTASKVWGLHKLCAVRDDRNSQGKLLSHGDGFVKTSFGGVRDQIRIAFFDANFLDGPRNFRTIRDGAFYNSYNLITRLVSRSSLVPVNAREKLKPTFR